MLMQDGLFVAKKAANAYAGRRRECLCRTAVQRMLMQDCTKQPRLMSTTVDLKGNVCVFVCLKL